MIAPYNPVEDVTIIIPITRVYAEVLHSLRTLAGKQIQVNVPYGGVDSGVLIQSWGTLLFSCRYNILFAWLLVRLQ